MKKKLVIYLGSLLLVVGIFQTCKKDDQHPVPVIVTISPTHGFVGAPITITGKNFAGTGSGNEVKFNGVNAIVTSASSTQLITTVPVGASTGKITIKVTDKTAISADDFTVVTDDLHNPAIISFSPTSGAAGTQVLITGTNFSTTINDNVVKFNNQPATVTAATATQLTVSAPASASTGKITVTVNNFTATSAADFTVSNLPAPTITSFSPSSGTVGSQVVITGTNFDSTPGSNTVKFNNQVATIAAATATQLTVTVPTGATTGKISITTNNLTATSATDFTIVVPPTITALSPSAGSVGTEVVITGTNFSTTPANNTVTFFNNVKATVTNASATQLTVSVPAGAATGKITIVTQSLTATSSTDFTVTSPAVTVGTYSPAMGLPGDVITISGTNFSTTPNQNQVLFGGNATANVTSATSTALTVTVPPTATTGAIKVTVVASSATGASSFEILQDIPRAGLVAFYPFSGNLKDASGNGFHLDFDATTASATDRFGLANKAYYFAGGNAYAINTNASQGSLTQPLTLSAWIKYDQLIPSAILMKFDVPNGYLLSVLANGAIEIYMDNAVRTDSGAGTLPTNTAGQWIMISVTFDGSTAKFYKNGNLVSTVAISGQVTATGGMLRVGLDGVNVGSGRFFCSIDDVVNYNRILSATEIQQLYTATVSKK